jgi:hypothetical protein
MSDLVVFVPSRGRPEAARALVQHFANTCTVDTFLAFVVDEDDPSRAEYETVGDGRNSGVLFTPSHTMVEALNIAAGNYAQWGERFALGFMGDDHVPRTYGWDRAYVDALREMGTGIVYGNDLIQGERLPTQCAMTSDIVRALGHMAPPTLRHMYCDDYWRDLGQQAGCLRYLPDLVVEHMHPVVGKAEWDEGHRRVNAAEVYSADAEAYRAYWATSLAADVAKVKALREAHRPTGEQHEWRLFPEGTVPEYTLPEWYADREHAPHLEQDGHRARLLTTATFVAQAAFAGKLPTVVDLGAGDGGLLSLLGPSLTAWGYDLTPANLEAAKERGVDVRYGDVVEGALSGDIEYGEVAVCTEMLEHLVDPHGFLRDVAPHVQALVCSSPADERPGQAYEFHTWAWDLDGYRALVEQAGFKVIRQRTVDRFQVILAVKP